MHQPYNNTYVGCYGDWLLDLRLDIRDLNGLGAKTTNFYGSTSIDSCVNLCFYLGFIYAGSQNG